MSLRVGENKSGGRVFDSGGRQVVTDGPPADAWTAGTVAVDDSATEIVGASDTRRWVSVTNLGADTVFVGVDDEVTAGDGYPLAVGDPPLRLDVSGAVFAICDTAESADVRFLEVG